jgi:anti-sigma regulatory factor (Ser/Thr protein kinase)
MNEPRWDQQLPPQPAFGTSASWDGRLCAPADITELRRHLRAGLTDGDRPPGAGDDDIERLLLIFEELASNGLRHGQVPVRVVVTTTDSGWLIDVSDAAPDTPPAPAVGRAAAAGGLGLYLVARLSSAYGWAVRGSRKHVWARIDCASEAPSVEAAPPPRPRRDSTGDPHLP